MLKNMISRFAQNDVFWFLMKPIVKLSSFMTASRSHLIFRQNSEKERQELETLFGPLFAARQVLHGSFSGMKYPELNSIGSTLYPKLLGSYERELHSVLEEICSRHYGEVINIGCGEGYYAVGLGLRLPLAKVIAFDTNEDARRLCYEMAVLNKIESRVEVKALCTSKYLGDFRFSSKGLIVCDCEGFELELFNQTNVENLRHCDLLIETHDFVDISISTALTKLFSPTHNITTIKSVDDIEKAKTYEYPESAGIDLPARKKLFAEKRPAIMEWLFMTTRNL